MRVLVGVFVVVGVLGDVATAAPAVRPGSAISADVVACDKSCWLARMLVPDAWLDPDRELVFDGVGTTPFKITSYITTAHGDVNGESAPSKLVMLGDPVIVGGSAFVPVSINKELQHTKLEPDHYLGVLRIEIDGTAIDVPLDLRVRTGPVIPFLCILIGLVLGIVWRWWTSSGQRAASALARIRVLEDSVARASQVTRDLLAPMAAELADLVNANKLETFDADVVKVEHRRDLLMSVERLSSVLGSSAKQAVAHARELIALRLDEKAALAVTGLEDVATSDSQPSFSAKGKQPKSGIATPERRRKRLKLFLVENAGVMLRVITVFLLGLLGLKALYVDGDVDFGAQPLYDHLVLILWGLGSEISSRGLANLGDLLGTRTRPTEKPEKKEEPEKKDDEPVPFGVTLPDFKIKRRDPKAAPFSASWPHQHLDIDVLREKGLTGKGTTIAVVDTGVDTSQTSLHQDRITSLDIDAGGSGADHNGHGTSMIGLLASRVGVCKDTKILSIRALDSDGNGTAENLIQGIKLAIANGADVISISAGQPNQDADLDAAVAKAIDAGIVVVGAIRHEAPHAKAYPAACDGVIAVTPSTVDDGLEFENPPKWVACGAPGIEVPTYDPDGEATITGSSPAAALVAGVCSLLLSGKTGAARRELAGRLAKIIGETGIPVDGGKLIAVKKAVEKIG